MKKCVCLLLSAMLSVTLLVACGTGETKTSTPETSTSSAQGDYLVGEYVLESAVMNGRLITSEFSQYTVTFRADGTMSVLLKRDGITTLRNSTYVYDGAVLTESNANSGKSYRYVLDFDGTLVTSFDDYDGTAEIVLKKKETAEMLSEVDFKSVLFGESLDETKIYNYCPAIITEKDGDGNDVMHVWYCTNKDSGVIVDHIGYRTGVKQANGKWKFSEERIVLAPTENTWDSEHTCDPAVIRGEFNYHGEKYNYLMAYLGCTTTDYQKNETGIAVAKELGGPWVKIDEVNPIVPWYDDGNIDTEEARYQSYQGTTSIYWGTGMPALLSVDGKGEVLLFNQSTLRGTAVRRIDLSDVANPVVKYTVSLSSNAILNSQNGSCRVSIPDFAYDETTGRLYVVSVTNEKNPADITKTLVNSHSAVAYVEGLEDMEAVSAAIKTGTLSWKMLGYVGPNETGWERNHNPGMVRDEYGRIPDRHNISVIVSTGHRDWPTENIFTYRLYGWTFTVV
ncbi:MAG: hypothetical protein J5762_07020 [Clostridia bacterium]|nr:hypothetical protein [Clostridia bacterium]